MQREFKIPKGSIRKLNITDLERIDRFRKAGYGGNVSDALAKLGVRDTVLSQRFTALIPGMQLVGRALPIQLHTLVLDDDIVFDDDKARAEAYHNKMFPNGHPQKQMMRSVDAHEPGTILCFDCGGDMQPAHFGEMSCQLAYAHGCRGMLLAGNCRDTQYIMKMADFPMYSFGTTPNAFGGWIVKEVDVPIMLPGHLTHYVRVFPGDFIFADRDGVQVIPGEIVDEILLRVEETHAQETRERELIAAGMSIDDVYKEFGVL